jgi:hypothetical protein
VGLYGPRYFVVLPLGVTFLLWDRLRARLSVGRATLLLALAAPVVAMAGLWRNRDVNAAALAPLILPLYGTLTEFRDLGWAMDYYELGDRFVEGATLGSAVVPLLPTPVWRLLGVDKTAIYDQNSAMVVADAMGQTTGQRIGAYGEFYMNFGWYGALVGAVLYGLVLGFLDDRLRRVRSEQPTAVFLGLALAAAVFAQIGQLNVFTSTLTTYGYPLALVVLSAAYRPAIAQSTIAR